MHSEIAKLVAVQRLDARLEILRKEVERRPQALAAQGGEVGEMHERRTEIAEMKKHKKAEIERADLDVKTYDEKLEADRKRLANATNQTEYAGLEKQIERFEKEKGEVEEKLLVLYDELEMIRKAERKILDDLGIKETDLTEDEQTYAQELAEIRNEGMKLFEQREKLFGEIDQELRDDYELLFSRYRERSIVPAQGGVCTGCHLALSPQTVDTLRKGKTVVRCNNCSRILYLE